MRGSHTALRFQPIVGLAAPNIPSSGLRQFAATSVSIFSVVQLGMPSITVGFSSIVFRYIHGTLATPKMSM